MRGRPKNSIEVRAAALALIAILAGCPAEKAPAPPPDDAAPAEPDYRELRAAIAAERSRTYDRPPLFEPGVPGKAAEEYLRAVAVDLPFEVYSDSLPVLAGEVSWKKAPRTVHGFAASAEARQVADAILRGASRTDGRSIAPLRSDILSVIEGNPHLVTMLVALADAEAGQVARACRYLLALQRMAQDLERGAPLVASLVARTYQRDSSRLLRGLVSRKELSTAELRDLVGAYTRLVESQVTLGATLEVEALSAAIRVLESPLPLGEPESYRAGPLAQVATERRIAATIERRRGLAERTAYYEAESCRDAADRACRERAKYLVAMALREADFLATYLYLALELDRRQRGTLAPELAVLAPETIPRVPADPITGLAFEYGLIDGRRAIRRGATPMDGEAVEPRAIPAPGAR